MGNFKVYTTFNKSLSDTTPSAWYRSKLSITLKSKDLAITMASKNSRHTHQT